MSSRGPDGAGFHAERNVVLAHRRLAIRDREGGAQPLIADDGSCGLVFNGEIYNDQPLRAELESLGHSFRSRCDTEVVLHAFRQWGPEALTRLEGMFALGWHDFTADRLILARDRFGIKPLFLAEIDNVLVYASSIPAILAHPQFSKAPNFSVLSHYLTTLRLTLGRETVFSGICQLLPGELLDWQRGRIDIRRYWEMPRAEEREVIPFEEGVARLHRGLTAAVEKRLIADVPVGMFLSGGVDSNTIASIVRDQRGRALPGWCGGGTSAAADESRSGEDTSADDDFGHARRFSTAVGADLEEVCLQADEYLQEWEHLLETYATPVSTPTDVILYRLAAAMKPHVGVALGGEGADELLCGYTVAHWAGNDYDLARRLESGRQADSGVDVVSFRESLQRQYGRTRFASDVDHYFCLNSLIASDRKPGLLQPWVWQAAHADRSMLAVYRNQFDETAYASTQHRQTALLHRFNLESLLSRLDSATMAASLEARVPFTDHHLVEEMMKLPMSLKIGLSDPAAGHRWASADLDQRGLLQTKRVLRAVAGQFMAPEFAERRKASFPTPVPQWMTGAWQDVVQRHLRHSAFAEAIFQRDALTTLAGNPLQAGMRLWPLLNVIAWGERHFAA